MAQRNNVRVWLITVGEPLPGDGGSLRLLRTGIVASLMRAKGINVTWWTSRFDHHRKVLRESAQSEFVLASGVEVELLHGKPYSSNVSLARIRHNRQTAIDFLRRAAGTAPPDIIVCSYPTVELADAAVAYGQRYRVPVVLDIRDLWPDIFLNLAPRMLQPFARLALHGMFRASHRACAGATAIFGITDAFVDWGVRRAGRLRGPHDRAFPLAYRAEPPAAQDLEAARQVWDSMGVRGNVPTFCFFGTLGRQFDIPSVLEAARALRADSVRFVLCGAGNRLAEYQRAAVDLSNVIFPGWVSAAAIWALMERSVAGLAPYRCETSFTMSVPNKAIEYLAGGLPVLSSLSGELASLLERERCGWTWPDGDAKTLAVLVRRLLDDPAQRRQMADNAARAYRSHFVADVVYGRMIDHLGTMAGGNNIRDSRL